MIYRRFGRTGLQMPVLTCGGMRYQQSWKDLPPGEITAESQQNLEATVRTALAAGINHIETARGYGTSEYQLGRFLPSLPRAEIIVQTKIVPEDSEDAFLKVFETSMGNLGLDRLDLLAVHGINDDAVLDMTLKKGTLKACQRLRNEGIVRFIGFSSHARFDTLLKTIETDAFDYVNLHWFYFDQRNWPAIEAAGRHDMGVFIISPSDKGGKLYEPPAKLVDLCRPFTPMGFNDLFCLSYPEVHTLSIGASRPSDFDAHLEVLPLLERAATDIPPVVARLEHELEAVLGEEWARHWQEGLPLMEDVPGGVPLYHVLRLYNLARAYDMLDYGKMRYNLLGNGGHWFAGAKIDKLDWDALPRCLDGYRFADRLPAILREAHAELNTEDKARLSQSAD